MLTKQILRTIQSGKQEDWYREVTGAALFIATGGFLKEANELLAELWKFKLPHDRNTWLPDLAFQVLWHAAGEKPVYVPFALTDIDTIEIQHRQYCSMDGYKYKMPDVEWHALTGMDALREGTRSAAPRHDQLPAEWIELACLQLLQKALDQTELAGHNICSASSLAAELASRNNKKDIAVEMIKLWASRYHELYLGYNFPVMACNRHVASFLLSGIIAEELRLNKIKCRAFVKEAIHFINERMKNGQTLVYGDLNWKELMVKLSSLALGNKWADFTKAQIDDNWIGFESANEAAIIEAERRICLELPEDYRDFLKITNGFSAFPSMQPKLLAVEEIDFLKKVYAGRGESDSYELMEYYFDEEKGTIKEFLTRAIAISEPMEDIEVWLICPENNNDDWQCWYFDKYGESRFKSFRYYIEDAIQTLDENDF